MSPQPLPGSAREGPSIPGPSAHLGPHLVLADKAPPPKPLVMGGTLSPVDGDAAVRTRWQPGLMPAFPIEPANDPIQRLADDDRAAMTLLALALCATLTLTLLGIGLQIWQ